MTDLCGDRNSSAAATSHALSLSFERGRRLDDRTIQGGWKARVVCLKKRCSLRLIHHLQFAWASPILVSLCDVSKSVWRQDRLPLLFTHTHTLAPLSIPVQLCFHMWQLHTHRMLSCEADVVTFWCAESDTQKRQRSRDGGSKLNVKRRRGCYVRHFCMFVCYAPKPVRWEEKVADGCFSNLD